VAYILEVAVEEEKDIQFEYIYRFSGWIDIIFLFLLNLECRDFTFT
jgi:hypothetical protein